LAGKRVLRISTAKNYLMAVCQVVWWDLLRSDEIERLRTGQLSNDENAELVRRSRPTLYLLGVAAVIVLLLIRWQINDDEKIFATQFLIGGAVISLVPATLYALFYRVRPMKDSSLESIIGFASIAGGYTANLIVFLFGIVFYKALDTYAWGPIVSLLFSGLIMLPLYLMGRGKPDNASK
jgi:hypothetical protein